MMAITVGNSFFYETHLAFTRMLFVIQQPTASRAFLFNLERERERERARERERFISTEPDDDDE
jgi:hypothetical protein